MRDKARTIMLISAIYLLTITFSYGAAKSATKIEQKQSTEHHNELLSASMDLVMKARLKFSSRWGLAAMADACGYSDIRDAGNISNGELIDAVKDDLSKYSFEDRMELFLALQVADMTYRLAYSQAIKDKFAADRKYKRDICDGILIDYKRGTYYGK